MPEFDIEAFISELAGMGMRLTAVPLADGTLKIYRWRMMGAFEHARQIEALCAAQQRPSANGSSRGPPLERDKSSAIGTAITCGVLLIFSWAIFFPILRTNRE